MQGGLLRQKAPKTNRARKSLDQSPPLIRVCNGSCYGKQFFFLLFQSYKDIVSSRVLYSIKLEHLFAHLLPYLYWQFLTSQPCVILALYHPSSVPAILALPSRSLQKWKFGHCQGREEVAEKSRNSEHFPSPTTTFILGFFLKLA